MTRILGREILGILISRAIPIVGVLWLGWDARLVLFLLACEVVAGSVVLGWLFDYPARSTLRAVAMVGVFLPVGLGMWLFVSVQERGTGYWETAWAAFRETWFAAVPIFWNAGIALRQHMALARERDRWERFRANDRIGVRWIFHGAAPFFLFAMIVPWFGSFGPAGLAALLAAKGVVDLGFLWVERRMTRGRSTPG